MVEVKPYRTFPKAAKALHTSLMGVHRLAQSGELPFSKIGGKNIVFDDALEEYINKINNYKNKGVK